MKVCTECKTEKPYSEFYKRKAMKDGHRSQCKSCTDRRTREYNQKHTDKIAQQARERYTANAERWAEYRKANRERHRTVSLQWVERNIGRNRENTRRSQIAKINYKQGHVRWADKQYMVDLYDGTHEANAVFRAVGVDPDFTVDHIFPVKGETVSGLHCEFNLQILSGNENARKGNRIS